MDRLRIDDDTATLRVATVPAWDSDPTEATAAAIALAAVEADIAEDPTAAREVEQRLGLTPTAYTRRTVSTAWEQMLPSVRDLEMVRIHDAAQRVTFEVHAAKVDGRPRVIALTVLPDVGAHLAHLDIPMDALARLAVDHREDARAARVTEADPLAASSPPDSATVARMARLAHAQGYSLREALMTRYGRSVESADKWIRKARDAGYDIPRATSRPISATKDNR